MMMEMMSQSHIRILGIIKSRKGPIMSGDGRVYHGGIVAGLRVVARRGGEWEGVG